MTSVDYKVSKRLRKACKSELKASGCHQAGGLPADTEAAQSVKLSFVLLCLEDQQKSGRSADTVQSPSVSACGPELTYNVIFLEMVK